MDLSHEFDKNTVYWPEVVQNGLNFQRAPEEIWQTYGKPSRAYRQGHFTMGEHGGTHIDAPYHFNRGGKSTEELMPDQLYGPVSVVDVRAQCAKNKDYQTTLDDLKKFEKEHGRIKNGSFVFMNTGWNHFWPSSEKFFNSDVNNILNITSLHFPGWHWDAVDWLIKERDIRGVGSDASSTDNAVENRGTFKTHFVLGNAGRIGVEMVANIDALPPNGAFVMLFPMKITSGTGGPTRIIGILPSDATSGDAAQSR